MNKVCKEYISDAKKFFPVMGKKEREYLNKVRFDIEDFVETENITTKSELVEKYHQPYEVANNYYATFFDTELIVKRIKISKYIKAIIITFIIIAFAITSLFCIIKYQDAKVLMEEKIVGYAQTNQLEDDEKEHDVNKGNNYDSMIKSDGEEIIDEEEIIE